MKNEIIEKRDSLKTMDEILHTARRAFHAAKMFSHGQDTANLSEAEHILHEVRLFVAMCKDEPEGSCCICMAEDRLSMFLRNL